MSLTLDYQHFLVEIGLKHLYQLHKISIFVSSRHASMLQDYEVYKCAYFVKWVNYKLNYCIFWRTNMKKEIFRLNSNFFAIDPAPQNKYFLTMIYHFWAISNDHLKEEKKIIIQQLSNFAEYVHPDYSNMVADVQKKKMGLSRAKLSSSWDWNIL